MTRINLTPTRDFHDDWAARLATDRSACARAISLVNERIAQAGAQFEQSRVLPATVSAMVLDASAERLLQNIAESLHRIVEQAIDWIMASPERLERYFGDHARLFPFLVKTAGLDTWQGLSRYDAVITPEGRVVVIELNTGCPAGFMHAQVVTDAVREAVESAGGAGDMPPLRSAAVRSEMVIDLLLDLERRAGITPELIALTRDENGLMNELHQLREALAERGRRAEIVDAEHFTCTNAGICWQDRRVSLSVNKIRISTEHGPLHHWRPGFQQRYEYFLRANVQRQMVSINNLLALSVAEDKGMLAVLGDQAFRATLDDADRAMLDEHVAPTARLVDGVAQFRGETIDLLPAVRAGREDLVIKPANEGRGLGVTIGPHVNESTWQEAAALCADLPKVVQSHTEPVTLPVISPKLDATGSGDDEPIAMFGSVGLALVGGRYAGLLSRVSPSPVNNVGREGLIQAVFTTGD